MAGVSPLSEESPLFCYAIRKLNPEVFSHPIWVRFNTESPNSPQTIHELLKATRSLEQGDPLDTCQLLLLCATCQSCAGQYDMALEITKQAHSVAKHAKLLQAKIWADWGAAAVCCQWGKYDEATRYLISLKKELAEQGDWILADFVEIIGQSLSVPDIKNWTLCSAARSIPPTNDLLICALDWLCHWGFASSRKTEIDSSENVLQNHDVIFRAESSSLSVTNGNGYGQKFAQLLRKTFISLPIRHDSRLRQWWVSLWKSTVNAAHARQMEGAPESTDDFQQSQESLSQPVGKPGQEAPASLSIQFLQKESSHGVAVNVIAQMLGTFSLTIQDLPLKLPASRSLSLLRYLILHHSHDTPRDMLMDIFWPEAEPEAARNNLNVAVHNLRQALRSITDLAIIRFEDGAYGLAKNLELWLDVEEFEHRVKEGQRLEFRRQPNSAVMEYEIAINLYRGDFLNDTPYESWTILNREQLRVSYLDTLDRLSQIYFSQDCYTACVNLCELILTRDSCREDVHRCLMQCYSRLGQSTLALRQYKVCVNALQSELDVTPAPATTHLYQEIRQHRSV